MAFPTAYTTPVGDVVDFVVLTLDGAHNNSTTTMTFNESIASLNFPCILVFQEEDGDFEIVEATATPGANQLTVTRGAESTTPGTYEGDEQCVMENAVYYIGLIRDTIIASQKYKGLVGVDAAKPGTCSIGEAYVATDTSKVYICFTANNWTDISSLTSHASYGGLADDDHSIYHNDARKDTWHTNLTGGHITSVSHVHTGGATDGDPIIRLLNSDTLPGSPQNTGDVYLKTDTNQFYVSVNGSSWAEYVNVPKGSLLYFESVCPNGWTRKSAWDAKFLKGALISSFPLGTGGALTHTHDLDEIVNHVHTITGRELITSVVGNHAHNVAGGPGVIGNLLIFSGASNGSYSFSYDGSHGHNATVGVSDTDDVGNTSPTSDPASSLPAYKSLLLCEKD